MFENDYNLSGKHATYVKFFVSDAKLYERYIDVYMNAAIFGLLYNRRAERDTDGKSHARIYADAFANNRADCVFIYRLVMLLDDNSDLTEQEKFDSAFRDDADENAKEKMKSNMDLFHSYVRGGLERMYEMFLDGCHTENEYLERAMDVMEDFKQDLSGGSYEYELAQFL